MAGPDPRAIALAQRRARLHELAQRLAVGDDVIYTWIKLGKLHARRAGRRLAIPFNDIIQAFCRQRLTNSPRPINFLQEEQNEGSVDELSDPRGKRY